MTDGSGQSEDRRSNIGLPGSAPVRWSSNAPGSPRTSDPSYLEDEQGYESRDEDEEFEVETVDISVTIADDFFEGDADADADADNDDGDGDNADADNADSDNAEDGHEEDQSEEDEQADAERAGHKLTRAYDNSRFDDGANLFDSEADSEADESQDEEPGELDPASGRVSPRSDPYGRAERLQRGSRVSLDQLFDFLPPPEHTGDGERLQKVLARAGVGSRRAVEELIEARRVRVNGEVVVLGKRVDPEKDLITIDGAPVGTAEGLVYYLLNKPAGVITTADDPQGRETVVDLVPAQPRVYPVGRLDIETEGLLVLTNDGELAFRLTHPSYGVQKEYLAQVQGEPSQKAMRALRDGVELEDGWTAPAQVNLVAPNLVRIAIHEGRNRQIRRMLEAVGHPVLRLMRTRIDRLADRNLRPGEWRELTRDEVALLAQAVSGRPVKSDPRFRK